MSGGASPHGVCQMTPAALVTVPLLAATCVTSLHSGTGAADPAASATRASADSIALSSSEAPGRTAHERVLPAPSVDCGGGRGTAVLRSRLRKALDEACLDGRLATALQRLFRTGSFSTSGGTEDSAAEAGDAGTMAHPLPSASSAGFTPADVAQLLGQASSPVGGASASGTPYATLLAPAALASSAPSAEDARDGGEGHEGSEVQHVGVVAEALAEQEGGVEGAADQHDTEEEGAEQAEAGSEGEGLAAVSPGDSLRAQARFILLRAALDGRLTAALGRTRRRRRPAAATAVDLSSVLEASRCRARQLTDSGGVRGACCTICLESLASAEDLCVLGCMHGFHGACVEAWLASRGTCPNCRTYAIGEEPPPSTT